MIDELFERLSIGGENSTQALEEFTDYRTYMDYDIKILHTDGSYSYYSKVCEEKSGGETQTPFLCDCGGFLYAALQQQHRW